MLTVVLGSAIGIFNNFKIYCKKKKKQQVNTEKSPEVEVLDFERDPENSK